MKDMKIHAIVAIAEDLGIGRRGELLWRIKEDLQRFKRLTLGHPVIMGRKTADSLPKPLPGRTNIAVTRNPAWKKEGFFRVSSLEEALNVACSAEGGEKAFIIGGGEIYRLAFPLVDVLDVTRIFARLDDADAWFPAISPEEWILEEPGEMHETAEGLKYVFERYVRKDHEDSHTE